MSKQSLKQQEQREAIERLRGILKPGDRVYTVMRNVSRSGMTRSIDLYKFDKDGTKHWLSYSAAKALEWPFDNEREAVKVSGAGMDMGFHLVYTLSRILFRDNYTCTGKNCLSNGHANGMPRPDRATKKIKHSDAGYALRQEWI